MGLLDLFRKKAQPLQTPKVDLYSDLTMGQKYSIMQLYSLFNEFSFGNFQNSQKSHSILMAASNVLGVTIQQANNYFETHGEFENLMKQMSSISNKSILDFLLLDYLQMVMLTNDEEKRIQRCGLITQIYEELGYTEEDIIKSINKVSTIMNKFNQ